jgi:hypothetical protein
VQGAFAGALDYRTIGDGIAERDAEFDDVGAGFSGGDDDSCAGFERGIAGRDVGDQSKFTGFGKRTKFSLDSSGPFFKGRRFA